MSSDDKTETEGAHAAQSTCLSEFVSAHCTSSLKTSQEDELFTANSSQSQSDTEPPSLSDGWSCDLHELSLTTPTNCALSSGSVTSHSSTTADQSTGLAYIIINNNNHYRNNESNNNNISSSSSSSGSDKNVPPRDAVIQQLTQRIHHLDMSMRAARQTINHLLGSSSDRPKQLDTSATVAEAKNGSFCHSRIGGSSDALVKRLSTASMYEIPAKDNHNQACDSLVTVSSAIECDNGCDSIGSRADPVDRTLIDTINRSQVAQWLSGSTGLPATDGQTFFRRTTSKFRRHTPKKTPPTPPLPISTN